MTRKRQLTLPGLTPAKSEPVFRARRDLSESAYRRALERRGVKETPGLLYVNLATGRTLPIESVILREPVRRARRATLARVARALRVGGVGVA